MFLSIRAMSSQACKQQGLKLLKQKAFINNEWVGAISGQDYKILNPYDGSLVGTAPDMSVEDAQQAITAASKAFETWPSTTNKHRAQLLRKWYDLLLENKDELAKIMTAESGKPITESLGEVAYGSSFIEWYSEQARRIHGEVIPAGVASKQLFIERQPIGVAGIITPWNFPLAMITRKVGAALAAGCTCVIRPAEDTPLTALAAVQLAAEAGIPQGVINVVTSDRGNAAAIGKLLCTSPDVAGIFFTGSTTVGKILYQQCASGVKRIGLELGGNAPFIVYDSADMNKAVPAAMVSKFRNCGQTCVASNRFLIQEAVYKTFSEKLIEAVCNLKLGDTTSPETQIGPLVNRAQFQKVSSLVDDAVSKGAKVLIGGKPATKCGELFYEPTVLCGIKEDMRLYTEEAFGPIIGLIKFETEEESIRIANGVQTGLAGYFCSEDVSQIFRVGKKLQVGMIGINEGLISTCEAPFGGVKESGVGREGSHHGIEDYTYYKYYCIGNLA